MACGFDKPSWRRSPHLWRSLDAAPSCRPSWVRDERRKAELDPTVTSSPWTQVEKRATNLSHPLMATARGRSSFTGERNGNGVT
jgi:hypothetical protein